MALDRVAALHASLLLRDFTEVGLRILAAACTEREVGRATYCFSAGEEANALSFIARGTVQLLPREGGAALGEVFAGDTLGGLSLLAGGEHMLTARAETEVLLLVLTREAFEALRKQKPQTALKLQLALASDLCERLREARGPLREFLAWQVSKQKTEAR